MTHQDLPALLDTIYTRRKLPPEDCPIFDEDFYKNGHPDQYPDDTEYVYANWTARKSRIPGVTSVPFVGLQRFILSRLVDRWQRLFFDQPIKQLEEQTRAFYRGTLGPGGDRGWFRFQRLHELGYLPLKIYAVPEGTPVPIGMPSMVMVNTRPAEFWLVNKLETTLSANLWGSCTSAAKALQYRRIGEYWARQAGETDMSFVDWQFHDFSYRGMMGDEAATLSGIGHLAVFKGTDNERAILDIMRYYDADYSDGGSIPATEHSVVCAGGVADEFETFRRLITEVYPNGNVSLVSDTWDLWRVLTEYIPKLRSIIRARTGNVVIRPDSGDPVKIMLGDPDFVQDTPHKYSNCDVHPVYSGVISLLQRAMGTASRTDGALPMINSAAAIYGDSITVERADAILRGIVQDKKLSPYNAVMGVGSYTYQMTTRDTYGHALKSTEVGRSGKLIPIFKKPITDDGTKNSHYGIVTLERAANGALICFQDQRPEDLDNCVYDLVYEDGALRKFYPWVQVRQNVRAGMEVL